MSFFTIIRIQRAIKQKQQQQFSKTVYPYKEKKNIWLPNRQSQFEEIPLLKKWEKKRRHSHSCKSEKLSPRQSSYAALALTASSSRGLMPRRIKNSRAAPSSSFAGAEVVRLRARISLSRLPQKPQRIHRARNVQTYKSSRYGTKARRRSHNSGARVRPSGNKREGKRRIRV